MIIKDIKKIAKQLQNIEAVLKDRDLMKDLDSELTLHLVEKRDALKLELQNSK